MESLQEERISCFEDVHLGAEVDLLRLDLTSNFGACYWLPVPILQLNTYKLEL